MLCVARVYTFVAVLVDVEDAESDLEGDRARRLKVHGHRNNSPYMLLRILHVRGEFLIFVPQKLESSSSAV